MPIKTAIDQLSVDQLTGYLITLAADISKTHVKHHNIPNGSRNW